MHHSPVQSTQTVKAPHSIRLREAAVELETVFLAEMLKAAGFGKPPKEFGGGAGEEQFSSFLVMQQAKSFAERGGIGLAEHIFKALEGSGCD